MSDKELKRQLMLSYHELKAEIEQRPISQLPALLILVAEQCLKQNVFVEGGLTRTVQKVIDAHNDGSLKEEG